MRNLDSHIYEYLASVYQEAFLLLQIFLNRIRGRCLGWILFYFLDWRLVFPDSRIGLEGWLFFSTTEFYRESLEGRIDRNLWVRRERLNVTGLGRRQEVEREALIDVEDGCGFPAYRGGPLFYADLIGLDNIYRAIQVFRERFGDEFWTPAPMLEELSRTGQGFYPRSSTAPSILC